MAQACQQLVLRERLCQITVRMLMKKSIKVELHRQHFKT